MCVSLDSPILPPHPARARQPTQRVTKDSIRQHFGPKACACWSSTAAELPFCCIPIQEPQPVTLDSRELLVSSVALANVVHGQTRVALPHPVSSAMGRELHSNQ